ncbi:hypothetical protein TrRE_jg232 [Triparma retinervis]|uniref:Coenzyme Q-binding protein COQ10 START domain-containing protein n=1 Tax=Triparma retinervis TaxID=2557542 RepID=A0A9W7DU76_9STRA|nr:hypothetical protein TrRE_jg232 [Triparma retinervis]
MDVRPSKLFNVVSDVDRYSEFVPYVARSVVLSPDQIFPTDQRSKVSHSPVSSFKPLDSSLEGVTRFKKQFQATLDVGFTSTFTDKYTSLVTCRREQSGDNSVLEYSVHAQDLGDSSFFYGLGSLWTIRPHDGGSGSNVEFTCWYVPRSSSVLAKGVGVMIDGSYEMVARKQMEAFWSRCKEDR